MRDLFAFQYQNVDQQGRTSESEYSSLLVSNSLRFVLQSLVRLQRVMEKLMPEEEGEVG